MRWFKDGDRNTRFFHKYVEGRRKKLQLTQIQTAQGDVITTSENICTEALSFFGEQFKKDNTHEGEEMLDITPKIIMVEQNNEIAQAGQMDSQVCSFRAIGKS
ncbi:hypothetical protein H5410_022020 [Solanum commersonii]|uniref:Uncharacterized protein n=1 Tax=Solanum commersonii TaxID=4109 RepID=A0A9J5ZCQ3_SOLCO|nr:hypothetical protein H5410_022020 [Solanum commersonii]